MGTSMLPRALSRCAALLIVLLLAACEGPAPVSPVVTPLDFRYLTPLPLNVATIDIQSQYVPSGVPPDVSRIRPDLSGSGTGNHGTAAAEGSRQLRRGGVGGERRRAGRTGDTITGAMSVTLNIYASGGIRAGYAQATVTRQVNGVGADLPPALDEMTRQMMRQMNVEFE